MAKKNSSKTATEKAIQNSEPRMQVFGGWQGVNFKDSPLGWDPMETGWHDHRQTDLKSTFFAVQNNLVTNTSLSVETRPDSTVVGRSDATVSPAPETSQPVAWRFTGVSEMLHSWLFCAVRRPHIEGTKKTFYDMIAYRDVSIPWDDDDPDWQYIRLHDAERGYKVMGYQITDLMFYEGKLVIMTRHRPDTGGASNKALVGEMFTIDVEIKNEWVDDATTGESKLVKSLNIDDGAEWHDAESPVYVNNPSPDSVVSFTGVGIQTSATATENTPYRVEIVFSYVNAYGMTAASNTYTVYTSEPPLTWTTRKYLSIVGGYIPKSGMTPEKVAQEKAAIKGVDVYASTDDAQTKQFIGHVPLPDGIRAASGINDWSYRWYGALTDTSDWSFSPAVAPVDNSTKGAPCSYVSVHDSRLYFWGDNEHPYRLYIGGNFGSELSIANGVGGNFVDIEPGTGYEVMGTAKWKTVAGANIVTIMSGNPNTNKVKRFNLIETNLALTNEFAAKSYMYEEVSNVQGCNSRWGYGVFADGLYSVNRYGLMLTTMAMEYNSQMRNQKVSENVEPIFTERLGRRLKNARMVYIDEVIYIILAEDVDEKPGEPVPLDQVVLCYDTSTKAWYTFTMDTDGGRGEAEIARHAFAIDSDEAVEGLGIVMDNEVRLYPTTGIQEPVEPEFDVLLESGEIGARTPPQGLHFLSQLELRFDYFVGNTSEDGGGVWVIVEGVDYYGRPFVVRKELNRRHVDHAMREYAEWIRIDKYVETWRIRIKGKARFRLTNVNARVYTTSNRIGMPYGYDAESIYADRHGGEDTERHYIKDYNSLRRALVP
jgi:hypothetical protein